MRHFVDLCTRLASTPDAAALSRYLRTAPKPDRVWAIALLSARRPIRVASLPELKDWAVQATKLPPWLIDDCQTATGDLAETIALVLPPPDIEVDHSLTKIMAQLTTLSGQQVEKRRAGVQKMWTSLAPSERMIFNKLVTGGFRVEASRGLLTRAMVQATGVNAGLIAHRLMANWDPKNTDFDFLISGGSGDTLTPYPFAHPSALEASPEMLGSPANWHAEWKWDGIRGQITAQPGSYAVWTHGQELITDRFPEFDLLSHALPAGTVLDGEILAWRDHNLLAATTLRNRLTHKKLSSKSLSETPAIFMAFDLLQEAGCDLRAKPFAMRRTRLMALLTALPAGLPISLSAQIEFSNWQTLATARNSARARGTEGIILKSVNSIYPDDWSIWKPEALSLKAVLIYAQSGQHGQPTLFTFAVKQGNELMPVTKTDAGLNEAELRQITDWVKANTIERFGPVRSVPPEQVFDIAFDGIQVSPRRKSGLALQNPRIIHWHRNKHVDEVDSIATLHGLLPPSGH